MVTYKCHVAKYSALLFSRLFSDPDTFRPLKPRNIIYRLSFDIYLHLK